MTAGQYTAFLNAVAATDTYGLYSESMSYAHGCGIQRSGSSGSFTYSEASGWANRPVNYVNWGDAARFTNWLHNGQPTGAQGSGTTETGAYALNGTMDDTGLMARNRKTAAKYWIPSENEWYKAAYHKNDGVTGNYFDYPTSSNTINPSMANYDGSVGNTTNVGAYAYPSPYGTFDQGGNLFEWNETAVLAARRVLRGGFWGNFDGSAALLASTRHDQYPTNGDYDVGFRVATVPEPGSLTLMLCGAMAGMLWWWRRGRSA